MDTISRSKFFFWEGNSYGKEQGMGWIQFFWLDPEEFKQENLSFHHFVVVHVKYIYYQD